ncbi:hypothetical protein V5N11_028567 [Cardamine amara subsp. amara]|uniref:Uncharacterized protein n=1 Tax=Cardamine amara subsp. amara TaxID=228776 RepID=A0ABD1BI72_CARAN
MNATKFVVLLLIGVLCANVGARQLEDTKLSISIPKTSSKGIGAELDVITDNFGTISSFSSSNAAGGPSGPFAAGYGTHSKSANGTVAATGPVSTANTNTGVGSGATSGAATSGAGATGAGTGTGSGSATGNGTSSPTTPAVER